MPLLFSFPGCTVIHLTLSPLSTSLQLYSLASIVERVLQSNPEFLASELVHMPCIICPKTVPQIKSHLNPHDLVTLEDLESYHRFIHNEHDITFCLHDH